jgi:integrase
LTSVQSSVTLEVYKVQWTKLVMKSYTKFTSQIRTEWVRGWVSEFLKGLETATDIKEYCQAKKDELIAKIKEKPSKNASENSWMNTANRYMGDVRKAVLAWQDSITLDETNSYLVKVQEDPEPKQQHLALLYMNFDKDFHTKRMEATNERKKEQRSNLESINCVDAYQETIDKLLESTDHRKLVVGLIAATGRRPSEIFKTAEFKQVGQFEVIFTGQIKAKGNERAYPTYTLVESAKVVDGLARLRRMPEIKELKRQTLAEIDSGKNHRMNDCVREFFSPLINPPAGEKELSAKNLRASYAAIAIYLFCPWSMSPNLFITERLGHTSDATATNYEDYQVCSPDGKPLTRGTWVERLTEEMSKATETIIVQPRVRMTQTAKDAIEDQEFLPFADQVSRMEELIRLARIGKQFEEGKLVKEVVTVINNPVKNQEKNQVDEPIEKTVEALDVEDEEMIEIVKAKATKKSSEPRPKINVEELSNADLFGSHAPNTGLEKIRRAVEAIKAYNERQYGKDDKWAINTKVLKDLTKCRTKIVEDYLKSDEGRINVIDYNLANQFTYQHNRGKGNISDFVKLV